MSRRGRPRRWEDLLAHHGGAVELLRLPAALFGAAVHVRGAAYDRGWFASQRLSVPVISTGNISTGGTGKTPLTAWLVRELEKRSRRPGILSRGWARGRDASNDEARFLSRACPGVPHVQDKDRVRGGQRLVEQGVGVIVLDDGFQHRRLARDLDLVLVDATRPWGLGPVRDAGRDAGEHAQRSAGEGARQAAREAARQTASDGARRAAGDGSPGAHRWLLPRGLLREPPSSLARADAIVISRCDLVAEEEIAALEADLARCAAGKPCVRARHVARRLVDEQNRAHPLSRLRGQSVDLVSGIGNPHAFEVSLEQAGAIVAAHRAFPDHHRYRAGDLAGLGVDARAIVTTQKDAVKLRELGVAFLALEVELEFVAGAAVIEALIDALPDGQAAIERVSIHGGLHG